MTPIQKLLLMMVKEIDEICKKNNIDYYLSGGSVIGAIRHKGFVPWDDDIDILMDRKNWNKFWRAAKDSLPPNRKLECLELNEQFNNPINRYVSTTTINVHKNELLGDSNAGVVIDIILLDFLPAGEEYFQEYVKNVLIYSDLINDAYMYLLRWQFRVPYKFYLFLMRVFGRRRLLNKYIQKMTKYPEEQCTKYVVASGMGPTLFDRSVFGKPRYVPFEDTVLPIPEKAYEFAQILYGYEWINVPCVTEQSTHDTITNFDFSYDDLIQRLKKVGWGEGIREIYRKHKELAIQWAIRQNRDSHEATWIEGCKVSAALENRIQSENIQVRQLLEDRKYDQLRELFGEYIEKQCSKAYTGGEMWEGLTRRHDPVYIEISDELLTVVLRVLMYDGELTKIDRILRAREAYKEIPVSSEVVQIKTFLENFKEAISLFDRKEYEQSLAKLESLKPEEQILPVVSKLKIRICKYVLKIRQEESDKLIFKEAERMPEDGEFIKYYADILYQKKGIAEAYPWYKKAFDKTRNGIIWNEICEILSQEAGWMNAKVSELTKMGETERIEEILETWAVIPGIWGNAVYQEAYFTYHLSCCDTEEKREELIKKIFELWEQSRENTSVLEWAYQTIMQQKHVDVKFPVQEILLKRESEYEELAEAYQTMKEYEPEENKSDYLFYKGVVAYRIGRIGEAFEIFRSLWRENIRPESIRLIFTRDLLGQLERMNRMKSLEARKYFIQEWLIKYPELNETAELFAELNLCQKEEVDNLRMELEALLENKSYILNLGNIMKKLYANQQISELKLID